MLGATLLGAIARMTVTLVVLRDTLPVPCHRTPNCAWVPPSQAPSHFGLSLLLFLGDRRCLCALVSPSLAPLRIVLLHQLPVQQSPGLQVAAVGRWACVFFPTHIFLQLPEEAICGDTALKARAPFGECAARPGGLCAVALGCTWLVPPAGTAFGFLASFSP